MSWEVTWEILIIQLDEIRDVCNFINQSSQSDLASYDMKCPLEHESACTTLIDSPVSHNKSYVSIVTSSGACGLQPS